MKLSILYRGPLSSCNYGCTYCPFAKHMETREEHEHDRQALERFLTWVESRPADDQIGIFFTPWGEALIRRRYHEAFIRLTHLPQVIKVAIQTNLTSRLEWVEDCVKSKTALWVTYHPTQITRQRFLTKCQELDRRGVSFSVGVVGLKEHAEEIDALRAALPAHIYLWINAYKRDPDYYSQQELQHFTEVDPLFPLNTKYHPSRGHSCLGGHQVISVDGDGTMRRCHFIKEPIGNIYAPDFEDALYARTCSATSCGCHIGYVHMPELKLQTVFGSGILERIPAQKIW